MAGPPRIRLAFLAYFHLGCAGLFPWSALITAADFWESQYPGRHMDRLLTVAYLPTNLATLAFLMRSHARLPPRLRIVGGFLGHAAIMLGVPLQARLFPPTHLTLLALLLLVAAAGACDALAQGAMYGEAAGLPTTSFTRALTSGASLAGVAVALLRLATKATLPDTPEGLRRGATLYFLLAAAVCAAAAGVYALVLPRLAAVRHYKLAALEAAAAAGGGDGAAAEDGAAWPRRRQLSLDDPFSGPGKAVAAAAAAAAAGYMELARTPPRTPPPGSPTAGGRRHSLGSPPAPASLHLRHPHGAAQTALSLSPAGSALPEGLPGGPLAAAVRPVAGVPRGVGAPPPPATYAAVLNRMWKVAATLVFSFAVTLTIFPGVLAEDEHSQRLGDWYPELLIAAYALSEWAGKNAPGAAALRVRRGSALLAVAVARAAFVPAFRLAAEHRAGPPVVGGLTAALGLSNGWLTSCAMMAAPAGLHGAAAGMAGTIALFSLVLGLNCGALLSFAWLL